MFIEIPQSYEKPLSKPEFLSDEEFKAIEEIKTLNPHESFKNLQHKIKSQIPRLKNMNIDEIKMLYEITKYSFYFVCDPKKFIQTAKGIEELTKMAISPEPYLYDHIYPYSIKRKYFPWTIDEDNLLCRIMENSKGVVNFSTLALIFPGRTGKQIYSHYNEFIKKDESLPRHSAPTRSYAFDITLHRYFLAPTEKIIADEIIDLFTKGNRITIDIIIEKAKLYYFLPWVLAERISYQTFKEQAKPVYREDKTDEYTFEFIEQSKKLSNVISSRILDEDGEVNEAKAREIMDFHKIPPPIFSPQWVKSFLKRNRLSWRHGHYSRRGNIDQEYAKQFLKKVALACTKYGYCKVFNMDETSVRIVNNSTRTVAPIGVDQIVINSEVNEKECFTAIGTCTKEQTYPLIIIAAGLTDRSCEKFKVRGDTQVWPSENLKGWMNEDIMIHYLDYLHHNWAEKEPCALLLDCFKAHCTKKVREYARRLFIELIYVPANGTSDFQPLDRRIFGIVKSKLRSLAGSKIYEGSERYEMIAKDLIKAWGEISRENLEKAWEIPNLSKLITLIVEHESNPLDEDFDLFADEEEEDSELFPGDYESSEDSDDGDFSLY